MASITGVVRNPFKKTQTTNIDMGSGKQSFSTTVGGVTFTSAGGVGTATTTDPITNETTVISRPTGRFSGGSGGGGSSGGGTPAPSFKDTTPVTKETLQEAFKKNDIKQEQARIDKLKSEILFRGGRTREVASADAVTKKKVILRTTKDVGGGFGGTTRVHEVINATTGETITQTFEKDKRGRVRGTGGIRQQVTKVVKPIKEKLNIPSLFQDSTPQSDSNKTQSFFNILKTSETYPELIGTLYGEKVPTGVKERLGKGVKRFKKGGGVILASYPFKEAKRTVVGLKTKLESFGLPTKEEIQTLHATPEGQEAIKIQQFLLLGAGTAPRGIGSRTIKEVFPLRQKKQPVGFEAIETKVVGGKSTRLADFTIFTEKQPPRVSIETSFLKESLGIKPKVKFLPAVESKVRTPFKATVDEPFITLETKGGRVGKVSEVSGISQSLELTSFNKLPKTQQFLVRRLAESKTGGVAVADKNIAKILTKDDLRFISDVDVEELGKFRLGTQKKSSTVEATPRGKRIRRFQTISETQSLGETELEVFSKTNFIFKDVTKPLSRSSGKTPKLTIFTKEKLKQIILTEEPTKFIRPADITKTPFSKTFQIQQPKTLFRGAPPPTSKAKTTTTFISPPTTTQRPISLFSGTGLYERTEGGQVPSFATQTKTTGITIPKSFSLQKQPSQLKPLSSSITKSILKPSQRPSVKSIPRLVPRLVPKEITKEISKVVQKPQQKQAQKLTQKQIQKQIFKPLVPFTRTPPTTTRKPPKKFKIFLPKGKSSTRQPKQFNVFLRRRGKFKLVGQTQTQSRAFEIGRGKAAGTLGATFKVEGGGVQQPIKIPGFKTKKSKKGTLFIELPKFRLSKKTETKEIQLAKRSKPRKKKKGGRK